MQGEKRKYRILAGTALAIAALLLLGVFWGSLLLQGDPRITASRRKPGVEYLVPDSRHEMKREGTPMGVVTQYRITPDELERDTSLLFFAFHQYVDVYLDGELIYSMRAAGDGAMPVKTPGCGWVSIPVYREDAGREFLVELIPVYSQIRQQETSFMLGSEYALLYSLLFWEFPWIAMSGMMFLLGVVQLIISVYLIYRKKGSLQLLSMGAAALCMGLWRLMSSRFVILLLPADPVFLYHLSITMMIAGYVPGLCAMKNADSRIGRLCHVIFVHAASAIFIGELLVEVFGPWELRQMLPVTFSVMAAGGVVVAANSVAGLVSGKAKPGIRHRYILPLVFVAGLCADQLWYQIFGYPNGMMCTMVSFSLHILMTGMDFIRAYSEQEKALADTEVQLTQSRIAVMMNQIRSHFIFNILNAISGMCKYDPERADSTVVCFARYLRTNIDIMQEDAPVTFRAALQHLEDYVVLEQIRFGDQIRFRTDIRVEHFMIPPMLLQPLVENSIRHGLDVRQGGNITLRTREDGDWIRVEVEDDGVGFDPDSPAASRSVGLRNVRFRLEHMVGGRLEIRSSPGHGTTATILIPRKEAELCE